MGFEVCKGKRAMAVSPGFVELLVAERNRSNSNDFPLIRCCIALIIIMQRRDKRPVVWICVRTRTIDRAA